MSSGPTNPVTASPELSAGHAESAAPSGESAREGDHPGATKRATLQQRFEESRVGRRVITGIFIVILGTQVVWSMPESAIRRGLMPVIEPVNAINFNEHWSMFAPMPPTRVEEFEIDVTMADGSTRIWRHPPKPVLEKIFLPDRWPLMSESARRQQDGRKEFARWVVNLVTEPSDRPVKVVMLFHFEVLPAPGQPSVNATGTRVLYEEDLTGPR